MTDKSPAEQMREAAMIACYNIAQDWKNYAPAAATAYRVAARDCGNTIRALPLPPEPIATVNALVEAAENLLRNYLQDELDEPDLCVNYDHWQSIYALETALHALKGDDK